MNGILERRIRAKRTLHLGERVALGLAVAAGEVGRPIEVVLARHGLGSREFAVLRMLRAAGEEGLRHGEIAERMLLGNPDVTRLAGRLEDRGWILKRRDEVDRRAVRHRITPSGLRKLDELEDPVTQAFDRIVSVLGPASAREIVQACERAIEGAAAMAADGVSP